MDFKKIVKHLEVQAISIKIESSRLGNDDKGFGNLALNINNLANLISNQFIGFRDKSKILTEVIENAHNHINDLKINQQKYSNEILHSTRVSIDSLQKKYEGSINESGSINSGIESIHKEISSLVEAVQFQDITRQQIEHVIQVINDLVNKIELEKDFSFNTSEGEIVLYIYKTSKLQAAQLNNSRNELSKAISEITFNLNGISKNILGISKEISSLLDDTGVNCQTFITEVNDGLNNVLNTLIKNSEAGNDLSYSIEKVFKTIEELSNFINEISNIGSEIELISLNASVKAAHAGNEGSALGILADAIQKLSIDAKKQTGSVIERLISVKEITERLFNSNSKNALSDEEAKLKPASAEINKINCFLSSLIVNVSDDLNKIQKSVLELDKEIDQTIKSNKNYQKIENKLDEIVSELEEIVYESEKFIDKSLISEIKLTEINKKYTMQVQRDIHNSIINENLPTDEANNISIELEPEIKNNNSNEFGDNVELF